MSNDLIRRYVVRSLPIVATLALASPAAYAWDFQNDDGTFSGSWDTTLTYGQAWRIESRDCRLIAIADGGCGRSPNIDDGNLNYDTDMFSRALKVLTELSLNYRGVGAFVRASALYDDAADNTQRTPLSEKFQGPGARATSRLLDAFVYAKFDLGSMGAELRLGRQAVSWGESTFIQNGINVINHFDVSALRVPGSELKEAFLPQEMVNFSLQFNDNLSAQAIYITDWNATVPEPAGSYYSSNDFAPAGGSKVVLGFGSFSDQGVDFRPLGGPYITNFQTVNRLETRKPDDQGQFGVNLKYYAPNFNNGTEFGLFFLNYHSRLPLISGQTGTQRGVGNAFGALNAVGAAAQGLAAGLPINAAIATAAQLGVARSAAAGGNLDLATATQYATVGANTQLSRRRRHRPGQQHRHARVRADRGLLHRVSRGHQAHRPVVQYPAAVGRHRAAGRGGLSPGRAPAVRRRGTAVRGAHALRAGAGHAARHAAAHHLPGRRAGGVDAHALRPARRLRPRPEGAGLGPVRHLPGAVHGHQDLLEHPQGLADGASWPRPVSRISRTCRTSSPAVRTAAACVSTARPPMSAATSSCAAVTARR